MSWSDGDCSCWGVTSSKEEQMKPSVLVAYATKYGSTHEVAEYIAILLREGGLAVDVMAMRNVQSLEGYGAVVLGAPLYIGRWHKDAHNFLEHHRAVLEQRQVAFFTLGPTEADEESFKGVREQLEQEWARYPWLKPVATELFGGVYDPAKLRFPDSLLAKLPVSPLHGAPKSDARDWEVIGSWASGLVALFARELAI
jgi:menaquinone-dependent protoporphyrinogen oxidase